MTAKQLIFLRQHIPILYDLKNFQRNNDEHTLGYSDSPRELLSSTLARMQ